MAEPTMMRDLFRLRLAKTSPFPMELEVGRALGSRIFDTQDRPYLDFISGIAVSIVGHRHPRVLEAVRDQLDRYWHTMVYGEHIQTPQVRLATLLSAVLGPGFEQVYLVNSGAEAIEGAMKLVKKVTGRRRLVSFRKAYHGGTHGALSLLGDETYKSPFRPLLPETFLLEYNDIAGLDFLDERVAGVFVEAVQAEAGAVPADAAWWEALTLRCKRMGIALVVDEIQTGLGRCGHWFAFQAYGVQPDVVVMAKGLGGGLPIGAFAASTAWMQHLASHPMLGHLTTFGGNPVCAAAATAVLEVIRDEDLVAKASVSEAILRERVRFWAMQAGTPLRLSGQGLLLALDMRSGDKVQAMMQKCWSSGLLVDWFLFNESSIRLAPPLNISEEDLHWGMDALHKAWKET
ncbi:MAG: aspartate aminotransferase family protein [Bacteroidota bacterium]